MRHFTSKDEKSDKFWKIELKGDSYTVRYGPVGTNGQTRTKTFDSPEKALKAHDKQIAAKLKKNYVEEGGVPAPQPAQSAPTKKDKRAKKDRATQPAAKASGKKAAPSATDPQKEMDLTSLPVIDGFDAQLGLNLWDWHWGNHQVTPASDLPEPRPFDLKQCLATVAKIRNYKTDNYGFRKAFVWQDAGIPDVMTPQEAHFWYSAIRIESVSTSMAKLKAGLKDETFDSKVTVADVLNYDSGNWAQFIDPWIAKPLFTLIGADGYVKLVLAFLKKSDRHSWTYLRGLQFILPLFTPAQVEKMRQAVCPSIIPTHLRRYGYKEYHFTLATFLGLKDELELVLGDCNQGTFDNNDYRDSFGPMELILGLADGELAITEKKRLALDFNTPDQIRGWLALTGMTALDEVASTFYTIKHKGKCEWLFTAIEPVKALEAVPLMLALQQRSAIASLAKAWLEESPLMTIGGILHLMGNKELHNAYQYDRYLRQPALEWLRAFKRQGYGEQILGLTDKLSPEIRDWLQAQVIDWVDPIESAFTDADTPDWLKSGLTVKGKVKPITWITPNDLPFILIKGRALNPDQITALLQVLKTADKKAPRALIDKLKQACDGDSLEDFGWALFECWLHDSGPSKEKWAMLALGFLGGDNTALKLTAMIRKWPGESQHARAVNGLDVLRRIGSKTALMQLSGISLKLKFKALKARAQEAIEAIAADMGILRAELEDMVVPDCGLDEKGQRVFDYGPRKFHFVLGGDLKPKIRDEAGKLRANPPKPAKKDDAEMAPTAEKDWKLLKKQIREIVGIQAPRLEQAMVICRRWSTADYTSLIARHPLMTHLAQMLLWGGYDDKGKLTQLFRLTDEQDYAGAGDEGISLDSAHRVGIVHPLELSEAQKSTWGQVFSDYEIMPPFLQLGRPVAELDAKERSEPTLTRFHDLTLAAPTLVFGLEKVGWVRGLPADAGGFDELSKQFPTADVTVVVYIEGIVGMGYIDPEEELTITSVRFYKGLRNPSSYWDLKQDNSLTLENVDPIVLSEVIMDMNVMVGKAR